MATTFTLPRDGPTFIESVFYRADELIRSGIWEGIRQTRLRRWRANFSDELERYFSACVLDALIYRSTAQTEALLAHLWNSILPATARANGVAVEGTTEWLDILCSRQASLGDIRIVPIVTPQELTKSGYVIARLLEKKLRVVEKYIVGADSLSCDTPSVVVFIDDFLGSGTQFHKFARRFGVKALSQRCKCIYAPLAAHGSGVKTLRVAYPDVICAPAELLGLKHSLFSSQSRAFDDGENSAVTAKAYYRNLRRKYAVPRGFTRGASGHLATTYVFQHAVPNNNIELLWTPQSATWNPLFDR